MTRSPKPVQSDNGRISQLPRRNDDAVQSLVRALHLLELLAEDAEGYRLIDLAERAGLATSTVHRLLITLEQERFVYCDREAKLWFIGVRCFAVGAAFAHRRNIATLALPVMRRLRDATGETVNLGIVDQGDSVLLAQVESRELMRAIGRPGDRKPLSCTAMGRAILATMPREHVSDYLQKYGLRRLTPNSIARPTQFYDALEETRRDGYAVDHEENAVGLRCIAAVVGDEHDQPVAALSIAGPTVRVTIERVASFGPLLQAAAQEISTAIGGRAASR